MNKLNNISFQTVPEFYTGVYPHIVVHIKSSQRTPKIDSELNEELTKVLEKICPNNSTLK